MARTTAAAVQTVLAMGADYDTDRAPDLTPAIEWATSITDDVNECAIARGVTHSAAKLELIERYLAAHAYAMSDQTYASRSTMGASGTFHGQTGLHLDGTKYGQMAKGLDPTGCLSSLGMTAQILWGGTKYSEQRSYEEMHGISEGDD